MPFAQRASASALLAIFALMIVLAPAAPAAAAPPGPVIDSSGRWTHWGNRGAVDLYGIDLTSRLNGWAVGAGGAIRRWNGADWVMEKSPVTKDLNAISVVPGSTTEAYAVGPGGTIIRRQPNGVWVTVPPPASFKKQLDSIHMLSATEGWIVGDDGAILHTRTGPAGWSIQPSGVDMKLHAVAMFNRTDGFAVGEQGTILRYNGTQWRPVRSPRSTVELYHVIVRGMDEAWAVGTNRTILRWTRTADRWEVVHENIPGRTGGTFYSISMPTADGGLVAGTGGELWQRRGAVWSLAAKTGWHLYFVRFTSAGEGWAVGRRGAIWRYVAPTFGALQETVSGTAPTFP